MPGVSPAFLECSRRLVEPIFVAAPRLIALLLPQDKAFHVSVRQTRCIITLRRYEFTAGPGKDDGAAPSPRLTSREREIIQLIAEGKTTKQIASLLEISVKTVETHVSSVLRKLQPRREKRS